MFSLIILFLLIITASCLAENVLQCGFNLTTSHKLENEGFHRLLEINVILDFLSNPILRNACNLAVYQVLPSGVFVDPEQLNELSNKLSRNLYYINETINVEASANDSKPINIYMIYNNIDQVKLSGTADDRFLKYNFSLPIHTRYHSSQHGGEYRTVVIPNSSVLVRCEPLDDNMQVDFLQSPCVERFGKALPCDVTSFTDEDDAMCEDWYKVSCNVSEESDKDLVLTVPVGDLDHLLPIQWITLVVTNLSAALILYYLFHSV